MVDELRARALRARTVEHPTNDAELGEIAACLGALLEMDCPRSALAGTD